MESMPCQTLTGTLLLNSLFGKQPSGNQWRKVLGNRWRNSIEIEMSAMEFNKKWRTERKIVSALSPLLHSYPNSSPFCYCLLPHTLNIWNFLSGCLDCLNCSAMLRKLIWCWQRKGRGTAHQQASSPYQRGESWDCSKTIWKPLRF